ncbi:MAG: exonuclease SbcCD subunit D C-terminal domain-containing protein [Actinomycetaceae bacterium]|nr:exonuclease SbcCD subunit D C-terminal domain-containing protein [Actinomycetaceae bacterium]
MKILHTSDWHLGRSLHGADLTPAFHQWCTWVDKYTQENNIDALLICGDVYDRSVPPTHIVELFHNTLKKLLQHTTVIITSGNHDSPVRLGFGADFYTDSLHIYTDSRQSSTPVTISDKAGNTTFIYPLPYLDPDVERRRLAPLHEDTGKPELLERSHEAVMQAALANILHDIHTKEKNSHSKKHHYIVMAHAFITGGEASNSENNIHIGGVDNIPSGLFRMGEENNGPLDYVALGHLHSPQKVGTKNDPLMFYSGSPIPFSFSEEKRTKSCVLLSFDTDGQLDTQIIPVPLWRPLATLEDTLENLLSDAYLDHRESFTRIIVTNQKRPDRMHEQLRAYYPHVLEISFRPPHTGSRDTIHRTIRNRDPRELLYSFVQEASGDITPEEQKIMNDTWEEANQLLGEEK